MSYAEYLQEHVEKHLQRAIAQATVRKPRDSVEFIGKYLLQIVKDDQLRKQQLEIQSTWDVQDKQLELIKQENEKVESERNEKQQQKETTHSQFLQSLSKFDDENELLDSWVNYIADKTNSTGVYITEMAQIKNGDDSEESGMIFVSTSNNHKFLLCEQLINKQSEEEEDEEAAKPQNTGITFEMFENGSNEDDEDTQEDDADGDDNQATNDQSIDQQKQRKKIHIANVLIGQYANKIHYFKMKKVGSYLTLEFQYPTYINEEAVQAELRPGWPMPWKEWKEKQKLRKQKEKEEKKRLAAEEKAKKLAEKQAAAAAKAAEKGDANDENNENNEENDDNNDNEQEKEENEEENEVENEVENEEEEEDEAELPAEPKRVNKMYAICMDTLGTSNIYDDTMIEWIDQTIANLENTFFKMDLNKYLNQRSFNQLIKNKIAQNQSNEEQINEQLNKIGEEMKNESQPKINFEKERFTVSQNIDEINQSAANYLKPNYSTCMAIAMFFKLLFNDEFAIDQQKINTCGDRLWRKALQFLKTLSKENIESFDPVEMLSNKTLQDLLKSMENRISEDNINSSDGIGYVASVLLKFVQSAIKLYESLNEPEKEDDNQQDAEES